MALTLSNLFDRTAFFIGAGASMDAGALSSKSMLTALRASAQQQNATGAAKEYSSIYDFILQSLIYQRSLKGDLNARILDLANIEDFVAVLRQMIDREYIVPAPLVGNWNSRITTWEQRDEHVFENFLNFTYERLLNDWTQIDASKAREVLLPFRKLIESDEAFALRIFSLNYDLMFESVFNSDDEHLIDTGFSAKRWTGEFTDPQSSAKLKLYKLHGSKDWFFDESDEEVKQGVPDGVRPLIVFGSGPKLQSYDPFLSLLAAFRETLKVANLYVVIGYSFQDRYINNILIQSLNAGLNKKILIVDPALPEDKDEFVAHVERVQSSKSLNEIITLTRLSSARVELCRMKAAEFYSKYMLNGAAELMKLLEDVEKGDQIF